MKKLSTEEKIKAYDEALEKAVKMHINYKGRVRAVDLVIEEVFPELKESDDERIRKAIIKYLDALDDDEIRYGVSFKDMRVWLKKQGEQKPAEWHREDEQNLNVCLGYIQDEYLRRWLMDVIHVKYDKPADKIEPKFKVGDEDGEFKTREEALIYVEKLKKRYLNYE